MLAIDSISDCVTVLRKEISTLEAEVNVAEYGFVFPNS